MILLFFGNSITDAITPNLDETSRSSPGIVDICGEYKHEAIEIVYGYGMIYKNSRDWSLHGPLSNKIDQFRYMLRIDFKVILTLMVALWLLRCVAEFRLGKTALRSFWLIDTFDSKDHPPILFTDGGDEGKDKKWHIRHMTRNMKVT